MEVVVGIVFWGWWVFERCGFDDEGIVFDGVDEVVVWGELVVWGLGVDESDDVVVGKIVVFWVVVEECGLVDVFIFDVVRVDVRDVKERVVVVVVGLEYDVVFDVEVVVDWVSRVFVVCGF